MVWRCMESAVWLWLEMEAMCVQTLELWQRPPEPPGPAVQAAGESYRSTGGGLLLAVA